MKSSRTVKRFWWKFWRLFSAADAQRLLVVLPDHAGVDGLGFHCSLVRERVVREEVARNQWFLTCAFQTPFWMLLAASKLVCAAEVPDFVLLAVEAGRVDDVGRAGLQEILPKARFDCERAREVPDEAQERRRRGCGTRSIWEPSATLFVAVLIVALPRREEVNGSFMIGPPTRRRPASACSRASRRRRRGPSAAAVDDLAQGSWATRSLFWYSANASPWKSLPPDLVTAVMMALEDFSYSALKFCVMTRNSWTAFCGNGLPRLASWPTTPPCRTSFL